MPKIDYTARDFDSNVAALQEHVRRVAPDVWNSFFSGDLGQVLLELMAYDASMLSFLLDQQTQESFIDTLVHRESLLHFVRLTGYRLRRSTPSSLEVYAEAANPPIFPDEINILDGARLRSTNGLVWEVDGNYRIEADRFTPVARILSYGDLLARNLDELGQLEAVKAQVQLQPGQTVVTLVGEDGKRFNSQFNFGNTVSEGHILKLGAQYSGGAFGSSPGQSLDEYAIVGVGKLPDDVEDRSVLYLERPWDGTETWQGKWVVENRSIRLTQGETRQEIFTAPGDADDRKNWEVRASFYPVTSGPAEPFIVSGQAGLPTIAASGIELEVNGILWVETLSLLFETPNALAYSTDYDELDRLKIAFGDGVFGSLIPAGAAVTVTYRVGGGAAGNVPQGSFNTSLSTSVGNVFIRNDYTTGQGGQDRESLTQAKKNIPQFVRSNDRAVTTEDYVYLASNFVDRAAGRLKLAHAVLHRNAVPRENNVVYVYSWAEGVNGRLAPPSLPLKRALLGYLNERKMITDEVVVVDGTSTNIPFTVRYRYGLSVDERTMEERVATAVNGYFTSLTPGCPFRIGGIYDAVAAVEGVEFVLVEPPEDVHPSDEHELFVNTVQHPFKTRLTTAAQQGDVAFVVENPSILCAGGLIMLLQDRRRSTVGIITSIQGSVVNVRADMGANDRYEIDKTTVLNSDYYPVAWQLEAAADIHVQFREPNDVVMGHIRRRIVRYMDYVILPEEDLLRSEVERIVSETNGVTEYSVHFCAVDSDIERIQAASREKVTLRTLTINGDVKVANKSRC
jgi:hypothetical protein